MEIKVTKPKRFSHEWWEYLWDYYKWYAIVTVIIAIMIITTLFQCAHKINYDLQVDYISEHQIFDDTVNALTELISENIDDVTENEKNETYVNNIDMKENANPQYTQAMYTKYSLEMISTEAFVFLVSKKYADELSSVGIFEESDNWTSAPSYNGYFISLEDCAPLKEIGIDTNDLYVGVLKLREQEKKQELEEKLIYQENGIKFARFLIDKE